MRKSFYALAFFLAPLAFAADDDNQIRDAMIKESVRNFVGSCGCPFHYRNDGKLCGVKSAYDLSNGTMPLCYRIDITVEMIEEYRARKDRPTSAVVK
ncbi:MAG: hypothetical protein EOP11_03475 [Proteobacteria bacterium]|nr:MAG: hypothetical protein EOP11_03475 [Pseudomonadota bacterium]